MIRSIFTVAFLLFVIPANAETMKLASHYRAAGKNPDGSTYKGSVDVTIISDTTFAIVWNIAGTTYKGFGMRMNDTLSATYTIDGEPGLIIYRALDDGRLTGLWAVRGASGSGAETLTPGK